MNEQWINDLRQKMTDYEWPVPEVSWDEIDQAVAANRAHKTRLLWLRRMAAAAVVLLIAGVGYWSLIHNDAEPMQPTTASVSNQQQLDENHALGSAALLSKEPVPMILAKSAHTPNMTSTPVLESETASPIPTAAPDTAKTITTTATNEKEQPQPVEEKKAKPADKTFPVIYPSDLHQRKNLDNRLTAKVYMSSTMVGSHQKEKIIPGIHGSPIKDSVQANHHQPVRFGISLRYKLTNRWNFYASVMTCGKQNILAFISQLVA